MMDTRIHTLATSRAIDRIRLPADWEPRVACLMAWAVSAERSRAPTLPMNKLPKCPCRGDGPTRKVFVKGAVMRSLCGVLGGVGAVLRVFQDVGSGRRPAQCLAGLLAGETLVDRQTHAPAAASGVHLHKRQGLGSAPGAHKSADRRR